MYERITGENAYETPMRIYPASHYTMGGLWVDYTLESTIPGLFVLGEANFSDHGANRLGASALMQGLVDGYYVIPYTLPNYLARVGAQNIKTDRPEFDEAEKQVRDQIKKLMSIKGKHSPRYFHMKLGKIMWEYCGMARSEESLKKALELIPQLREEFWKDLKIVGEENTLNNELERAGRVADFLEFAEVMVRDALERRESCGAHFRVEHQTDDGEAKRNDSEYSYAAVWLYDGDGKPPRLEKEPITHDEVKPVVRSYK
jgi:succinate dehydrogenase / fumarate reductase flavoprotein subunit